MFHFNDQADVSIGFSSNFMSVEDPGCLSRIPYLNFFHPGSEIFYIPEPGSEFFTSRIRIKEFKYFNFNPKNCDLSSRKYDPGCSSRIPDPDPDFLLIPDPGVKKSTDP